MPAAVEQVPDCMPGSATGPAKCKWLFSKCLTACPGPAKCQWLFSKCLTASDTNKLARIILPRQAVDAFLPHVEDRAGLDLEAWDTAGIRWCFKLKCARPACCIWI